MISAAVARRFKLQYYIYLMPHLLRCVLLSKFDGRSHNYPEFHLLTACRIPSKKLSKEKTMHRFYMGGPWNRL